MQIATFVCNALEENTFILYDETRECVIIDAGCVSIEEKEDLKTFIRENDLKVKYMLNTHLHLDHCVGADFITQLYGVKVRAHRLDFPMIEKSKSLLTWLNRKEEGFSVPLSDPIEEGEIITFGKTSLVALLVPGHSPGSLAFYDREGGNLFSGDVLFHRSVGRSDLYGGNARQLIESIKGKLLTLPDATRVYPGHGETTTIGEEKAFNTFIQ